MGKHKDSKPNIEEEQRMRKDERPERESPDADTLEGPGGRHEAKGEEDARNKTTRRGER